MCAEHNNISIHCTTDTSTYYKLDTTPVNNNSLLFYHVQPRPLSSHVARGKCSPTKSRREEKEQEEKTEKGKGNSFLGCFYFYLLFLLSNYWVVGCGEQESHYSHWELIGDPRPITVPSFVDITGCSLQEYKQTCMSSHHLRSKQLRHKQAFTMKPWSCSCRRFAELLSPTPRHFREAILLPQCGRTALLK